MQTATGIRNKSIAFQLQLQLNTLFCLWSVASILHRVNYTKNKPILQRITKRTNENKKKIAMLSICVILSLWANLHWWFGFYSSWLCFIPFFFSSIDGSSSISMFYDDNTALWETWFTKSKHEIGIFMRCFMEIWTLHADTYVVCGFHGDKTNQANSLFQQEK